MMGYKLFTAVLLIASINVLSHELDCTNVDSDTENLICANRTVRTLDHELQQRFKLLSLQEEDKEKVAKDHKTWLKQTRDKCANSDCLKNIYKNRISEINSKIIDANYYAENLLIPEAGKPEPNLTENSEIYLVSGGYHYNSKDVAVIVNRPNTKVILVLSSYESINWKVHATQDTHIKAIIFGGYQEQRVFSNKTVKAYSTKISYAVEENSKGFQSILTTLNTIFGTRSIDYFIGNKYIPTTVVIDKINTQQKNTLSLDYPKIRRPAINWKFNLFNEEKKLEAWHLTGPKEKSASRIECCKVLTPAGDAVFQHRMHNFEFENLDINKKWSATQPPRLTQVTFPTSITYDSKRNIYTASFPHGDHIYRYDANKNVWLDSNPEINFEITSIYYDKKFDRYVGWASDASRDNLVILDSKGRFLFDRAITDKLPGYGRLYDNDGIYKPTLRVVANGNSIALLAIDSNVITRIWLYDLLTKKAILTYRSPVLIIPPINNSSRSLDLH